MFEFGARFFDSSGDEGSSDQGDESVHCSDYGKGEDEALCTSLVLCVKVYGGATEEEGENYAEDADPG